MKLSNRIKLLYGFGFSAQGIKDGLFQVFLFFYFSQVLGLDPALTGAATILALLFDAVSDPLVGVISDRWESKNWGRRHPFMLVSALPLGIFTWLLFVPPAEMGQAGLFWWLTIFTILVRLSLTLFQVPGMSLGAELSTDYEERTSITSYRIMFGTMFSTITIMLGFIVFFAPTEAYPRGLMNPTAYPKYAFFCAVLIVATILISTLGTRKIIPTLPNSSLDKQRFNFRSFVADLKVMFGMRSYTTLILYTMIIYIGIGIGTVFTTYFMEYYFNFSEIEMASLPLASGLAGLLALFVGPALGRFLDKKRSVFVSTIAFSFLFSLPYNLRFFGMFPENGAELLLPIYLLTLLFAYLFLWIALSLISSMMADVVDEFQLKTNKREEGLFFSSMSFTYKCTVGLGYLLAGILLKWIAFPTQADVEAIPTEAINGLGLVGGPIVLSFYLFSLLFIAFYPITKKRYESIRAQLDGGK